MAGIQGSNELISADVFKIAGVEQGQSVGDLGSGNLAYYAIAAAKIVGKDGVVYAVDILKSVLEAVNNRLKQEGIDNIKTVWSDLEIYGATRIAAGTLDVAFIHNVLFQSKKNEAIIREAARLVKFGGQLMIVDWKKAGAPFGPPVADRPDPEALKKSAAAAGLKFKQEFEAGPYHFGLLFIK